MYIFRKDDFQPPVRFAKPKVATACDELTSLPSICRHLYILYFKESRIVIVSCRTPFLTEPLVKKIARVTVITDEVLQVVIVGLP